MHANMFGRSMAPDAAVMAVLMVVVCATATTAAAYTESGSLTLGFYRRSCPSAEKIVYTTVRKAIRKDPRLAPALIRMYFHDCFVRGCDASVLLDSTSPGVKPEKKHPANDPSLRGFEIIDAVKSRLERECPETVSCADIIAFAARDSTKIASYGNIDYDIPAGRRDGTVSLESDVDGNIPRPTMNARELENNFAKKGLTLDDMVILVGAHSIGGAHCTSFASRLYKFNSTHPQDPSMNRHMAKILKKKCPPSTVNRPAAKDPKVPFDPRWPKRLDTKYYLNLQVKAGLLTSDQTLQESPSTSELVSRHAYNPEDWEEKFAAAMVKLGYVDVHTGWRSQIRRNCRRVNWNDD